MMMIIQSPPIFYIHGYQSSPDGAKGALFSQTLQAIALKYRDGPPEDLIITDCLDRIKKGINSFNEVVLIGSSLGGLLASVTALNMSTVAQVFLLNPAIMPPETDIDTINSMPKRILREMYFPKLFSKKISSEIIIFRGTNDEVVSDEWVLPFAQYQEATVHFLADDHRFSKRVDDIVKIIQQYMD